MNPPFTKVERGIKKFVDMETFKPKCGGEVGLWGHFIMLADSFLKDEGVCGAVIPINVLRGRESKKVRKHLFENWTPLYILKPTYNYAFSEWAEYRDILFIAKKQRPLDHYRVKFCLVKKDLTLLTDEDVKSIANLVKSQNKTRDHELVDIDTHEIAEIKKHSMNMMWFCGGVSLSDRDLIVNLVEKLKNKLHYFPQEYFREGYRPVPKGVSQFLFVTRNSHPSRVEEAFLRFDAEDGKGAITAKSPLGVDHTIDGDYLTPTLRTSVGLAKMDITNNCDYIFHRTYPDLTRVCRAAGQNVPGAEFWRHISSELELVRTQIVVNHRINPFSPATYLNAFYSNSEISPSNQMNVILEHDSQRGKAVCTLLNSILFFAQFFLLKEESTGRFINIRFYDLQQMRLYPDKKGVNRLVETFHHYGDSEFPALRYQFDRNFDQRYEEFWEKQEGNQQKKFFAVLDKPIEAADVRVEFDLAVCKAIGLDITKKDLMVLYEIIVREMIITKGLKRD